MKIKTVRKNLNQWLNGGQIILYKYNYYINDFNYSVPILEDDTFCYTYNIKEERRGLYLYVVETENNPYNLNAIAKIAIIRTEMKMLLYRHNKEARERFKQLCLAQLRSGAT